MYYPEFSHVENMNSTSSGFNFFIIIFGFNLILITDFCF